EVSDGRLWLTILEDPLGASMRIRGDDGTRERHLRERQRDLLSAIASSRRLQLDAKASGDAERWLHETIKVHVNVGNQSDFAFRSNGYSERDIPAPLRAVASTRAQEQNTNVRDFVGRALQVHNEVGFGAKKSSIARAMLYNLAQPGAVIIVPDQLWMSETWAGM